nr:Bm13591 [Brugia malayi]
MKNDDLKNVKLSKTLSIPENIMSDSCVTTKVIRKQSVRFAGKSDLSKNEEKYLNLTNITTAKSINTNFMENNRTENINKQMNCKQFITSNVFFTEATKIEIEFAMKKKSNHATISQKFPSVLSEQMIAFVVV